MFRDRTEAGRKLAAQLAWLRPSDPVVLALPRGGVPVAAEIAEAFDAPLDLIIVRKVGAPGEPEVALAAIVDGEPPDVLLNRDMIALSGLDDDVLSLMIERERPELKRQRLLYFGGRAPVSVKDRSVILADDGAATGASMKAALRALERRAPREVVVALPVAPPDVIADLSEQADRIVCLEEPPRFQAVGLHYRDFAQLTDQDVIATLERAAKRRADKLNPKLNGSLHRKAG